MARTLGSLQRIADVLVIVASLGVIGFLAFHYFGRGSSASLQAETKVGDIVGPIEGLNLETASTTLLLALQSKCTYCTASVPFYRRLLDSVNSASDVQVVAIGHEPLAELQKYLTEHGLSDLHAIQIVGAGPKIRGTPTILAVSSDRQVGSVWRGQLTSDAENELMAKLGLSVTSRRREP